jgi:hypothetical protein
MTLRRMFAVVSFVAVAGCGSDTSSSTGGSDGVSNMAGKGGVAIVMSSSGGSSAFQTADANLASSVSNCTTTPATCKPEKVLLSAKVYLSSFVARTLDGKLIDVEMDLSAPVDLLSLVSGKNAVLPKGSLPPGTYDQIVIVMKTVELTLLSGMKVAISPPGGGWTAIVAVAKPFIVKEGETTSITLDFRMDLSFVCPIANWDLLPKVECTNTNNGASPKS